MVFVLFRFKGLRDHLLCILDEELSSMCLCALHCKMRNTEQLLKSVGLLAYEIGSLKQCNEELSKFGPENFHSGRITLKLKPGQQTAPGRNNISVSSFSAIIIYHSVFSCNNHDDDDDGDDDLALTVIPKPSIRDFRNHCTTNCVQAKW